MYWRSLTEYEMEVLEPDFPSWEQNDSSTLSDMQSRTGSKVERFSFIHACTGMSRLEQVYFDNNAKKLFVFDTNYISLVR